MADGAKVTTPQSCAAHTETTAEARTRIQAGLTHAEPRTRLHVPQTYEAALNLHHEAIERDFTAESYRAELIIADVQARWGNTSRGGQSAQQVQAWAIANDDAHLIARSHRVLGGFYYRLGDVAKGLESAVECVRSLTHEESIPVQIDHRLCLADALCNAGTMTAAKVEYELATQLARTLADQEWLTTCLNNHLYTLATMYPDEDFSSLYAELANSAKLPGQPVDCAIVDTLAEVRFGQGDFRATVDLLKPLVRDHSLHESLDREGISNCLLTFAKASRELGALNECAIALSILRDMEATGPVFVSSVDLLVEEATLAAARGEFHTAYNLQVKAYEGMSTSIDVDREAHARLLHTVYATSEAVADSARFHRLALLDPLTELGNRRFVHDTLPGRLETIGTQNAPTALGVAIVDLDHFKSINDQHSHQVGDFVLREIAQLLQETVVGHLPPDDSAAHPDDQDPFDVLTAINDNHQPYAARIGGEEFLLVIPTTDACTIYPLVEQVLVTIREHRWPLNQPIRSVTASIGALIVHEPRAMAEVLAAVDALLYRAKRAGRDRVVTA